MKIISAMPSKHGAQTVEKLAYGDFSDE